MSLVDPVAAARTTENTVPYDGVTNGIDLDFASLWRAVYRNRLIVILVPLLALLAGAIMTAMTPRQYQALATVQIEQQSSKVLSNGDVGPVVSSQDSERFLQTQLGLLNSKALAGRVIDSLKLAKSDEPLSRLGMPQKQLMTLGGKEDRRAALIATLRSGLTVTLPRDSRIAQVGYTCRDPELCAKIANAYVQEFIIYNLRQRYDESEYALTFLRDQLNAAKSRLEESERAAVQYATQSRLVDTSAVSGGGRGSEISSPTAANLVNLNTALSAFQTARIQAQQQWELAQSTPILSQPEVLQSAAIQSLLERKAVAQAAYAQERQRHKPDFPAMEQAAAQIAALQGQMDQIATATRASLLNRYRVARSNEVEMQSQISRLKSATLAEQGTSIGYNILRREVDTNRTMYDGLLQRYKEVSAAAGVTPKNISALDAAEVPNIPVTPKTRLNLATAGLVGVMLALFLIVIRERLLDGVRSPAEITSKLGIPLLGILPKTPAKSSPYEQIAQPRSQLNEAALAIATVLKLALPNGLPAAFGVTSSRAGEGKSTFSYAIARSFSRSGLRVLLIDADLRVPSLHRLLDLPGDHGLSNVLAKTDTIETCIQATTDERLMFLAAGPVPPSPAELLAGPRLRALLDNLHNAFDVMVVDGPPVLQLADAILIGQAVDACVIVVDARSAKAGAVRNSLKRLQEGNVNVIGGVISKCQVPAVDYVYG